MRALLLAATLALAAGPAAAQVELPEFPRDAAIEISADAANRWPQGGYDVWLLRGNCRIAQGHAAAQSREAVLWILHSRPDDPRPSKVIAYLEGEAKVGLDRQSGRARIEDQTWFGRFQTVREVRVRVPRVDGQPAAPPAVYQRGLAQFMAPAAAAVVPAQFTAPAAPGTTIVSPAAPPPAPGARRIRAFPRSNVDVQAMWFPDPQNNQWIALITSGVNLIVDGIDQRVGGLGVVNSIDLAADRLVIWTHGREEPDLSGRRSQPGNVPLEVYMEGNIVFRQGERVIYADRMYYDVANQVGTVLGAEMLTPVPQYEGLVRLRAEILQQNGEGRFFARDAFITSSRLGAPRYRLQAGDIQFSDMQAPAIDPWTGQPEVDPISGQPVIEHRQQATARNNLLYLGPVPVFWWPTITTDLKEPTFYLRRARLKNDSVYGFQVLTDWNAYELLGFRNRPEGTRWDISLDYLSKRGFGHGTTFSYDRPGLLGAEGPTRGLFDYWGIYDGGNDNLGADRRSLDPEADYRHRLFWQHRQQWSNGIQFSAEAGWISDRNFLEQYYQREWDELKDENTGIELKQLLGNSSWSVTADLRINSFFTQTDWLPRADHFWLGQSLFGDMFTWYEHSSIGYGRLQRLSPPIRANDQPFSFLPWEQSSRSGERLATRQEIDLPFQLGPVKVVPYALGELAHWGEDINGQDLNRAYGQAGVRLTLPMWRADPTIESNLFNVHGLAHKIEYQFEFLVADATRDLDRLPLYDNLDDDSIEAFRRRLATNTFGFPSTIPPGVADLGAISRRAFDERYYALRSGLGSWVTSPSTEIADDLMAMRLGLHQRWQTKRGLPGQRRIIDWVVFDTNLTVFPDETRDNFGKVVGLWDYDFRWHVGDRLTLVSDGIFDFFHDGQQVVTIGGFLSRPPRGNLYLGLRLLEGPIRSHILAASYSYWMSPKWVSTFGTTIDFATQGNIGQNFTVTRVGESLLVSFGVNVDEARKNVGIGFAIEPRILPKGRLGNVGGARIPPAGAFGLE